jgi:hypothetical protein
MAIKKNMANSFIKKKVHQKPAISLQSYQTPLVFQPLERMKR